MWFEAGRYITNGYKIGGFESELVLLKRGIYLDTAPLFLLVVGYYDKIKRTKLVEKFNYKQFDYKYLLAFLNSLKLHNYHLLITPHIFTEFIKHLWEKVDSSPQFKDILEISFKTKWYIKDVSRSIGCLEFMNEEKFINKEIEIGDVSICICAKEGAKQKGKPIAILTDDKPFAELADKKYNLLTIYYTEIKNGTILLNPKNIPEELLKEPLQQT